jgi:hypothetical protein
MELYDRGAWFTVKQRIDELEKWLKEFPESEFAFRRRVELEAAKEQMKKILGA